MWLSLSRVLLSSSLTRNQNVTLPKKQNKEKNNKSKIEKLKKQTMFYILTVCVQPSRCFFVDGFNEGKKKNLYEITSYQSKTHYLTL